MSWVFLADELVYKLKKPVRYEFLDFSTLEARRQDCEREVQLNRRLAADVYHGVVPLVMESDGNLALGGEGTVVDWLVKMRRLPAERMLDAAIREHAASPADIRNLSRALTHFYSDATRVDLTPVEYRAAFEKNIQANHAELGKAHYGLPLPQINRVTSALHAFLARHAALLEQRARARKILDAHGDLRPEHICLTPQPRIIDCLEFNRDFRLLDPVDELAYLAMECERLGAGAIGDDILRQYLEASGENVSAALVWFYKAFRACLRAKIAIWHIADHEVRNTEKWRRRAREYLDLAEFHVTHW